MKRTRDIKVALMASIIALAGLGWLGCSGATSDSMLGPGSEDILGSGAVVDEARPVGGFIGLHAAALGNVYIRQGAAEQLTIRADDNLLPYLHTEVQGGNLVIASEPGLNLRPSAPIEYHLTVRSLEYVELAGVGDIQASSLVAQRMSLVHTGIGRLEVFNLNGGLLEVTHSGVGDVQVSGAVQQQSVALNSAAAYEAQDLQSAEASVAIRNSGSATVRVSDRLDAAITGTGSVYYIGSPVVTRTGNGTGTVQRIG